MENDGTESKNNIRSIIKIAIPITITAVLFVSTLLFFFNLNGGSLDFSDSEMLVVPTGSMDGEPQNQYSIPTIPKDSIIMIHDLSDDQKKDLAVGDVVTFYQGGIYKVHRIVEIDGDKITTKGDANQSADLPITFEDIDGKVVGVAPLVGKVVSFIKGAVTGSPLLLFIGLVILVVMIYSIIEVVGILRNKEEEE